YSFQQLAAERDLLLLTSTFGDGDPPDNARSFWNALSSEAAPQLPQLNYSVLALGDSSYPKFCAFGRSVDERLEKLGAKRVVARCDCDVDYEPAFLQWQEAALSAIAPAASRSPSAGALEPNDLTTQSLMESVPRASGPSLAVPLTSKRFSVSEAADAAMPPRPNYNRSHPFPAPLIANRKLNRPGSAKETRHIEFALEDSGLVYEAGDALGVFPRNCPERVDELLLALGCTGEELVAGRDAKSVALRDALLDQYEITKVPGPLFQAIAAKSADPELKRLSAPGVNGELTRFLWGKEIIDLLLAHREVTFTASEFTGLLKRLAPRLYSIASSPKANPDRVHLCVGIVRYESLGRKRGGVCSTCLADRVPLQTTVPVFVHSNKNFRPPADGSQSIIMIGPGTGIAPFRAFLQERHATGARGRNWLFFGDQHAATDFLYEDEIVNWRGEGFLHRLDLAFSRDQTEKIYVQHRLLENARELFSWLDDGAHLYVCGDASRMAKDVHEALHQVVERGGGRTREQAAEYVTALQREKRYQRDVY
ncbi:MAG: sulfite reductase subunit alpha, partial [Verrucomicrobiota bacterium]